MKLIGINGYSGSGKSTLAKLIQEQDDRIGVIHMDFILNDLKEIIAKNHIRKDKIGEETLISLEQNPMSNVTSQTVRKVYEESRGILLDILVKQKMKEFYNQGYIATIIEGMSVPELKLNWTYLINVNASFEERLIRCKKRNSNIVSKDSLSKLDLDHEYIHSIFKINYNKTIQNKNDSVILAKYASYLYENGIKKPGVLKSKKKLLK